MSGSKSDSELRAEILGYREEARQLEREAADAGGYREDLHGFVDAEAAEARAQLEARLAVPRPRTLADPNGELERLYVRASPDYARLLHELIAAAPVEAFAGEDRKAHDAKAGKLAKQIADREAELARRDDRRAALQAELARVGAGGEAA